MSYTNVIFFALALLICVTYVPQQEGSVGSALLSLALTFSGYWIFTWFAYRWFQRKREAVAPFSADLPAAFGALEQKLMVVALLLYFGLIHGAGVMDLCRNTPVEESALLGIITGLAPFVVLLLILWANAVATMKSSQAGAVPRKKYLIAQMRLNAPIILPVLLFSALLDIFSLVWWGEQPFADVVGRYEPFVFVPFLLVLVVVYPVLLRYLWNCSPLPPGDRRKSIEASCRKAGLTVAEIYLWPSFLGKALTAGIAGVAGRLRYLFITPGLLRMLNDQEMEAVIAHEAGHIRKGHVIFYVFIFILLPLTMFLSFGVIELIWYGFSDVFASFSWLETMGSRFFSMALLALLVGVVLLYLRVFFGLLSRNFEREADLFVFDVVGHPFDLISSLEKISYFGGHARETPSWHHYGIGERIRFLESCQRDGRIVREHLKKTRRIKALCISLVVSATVLVTALNVPAGREAVQGVLLEAKIDRMLAQKIDDPEVLMGLAQALQEFQRYEEAISLYDGLLAHNPDNETALNNLAWLYATVDDASVRDKDKALDLARRAATIKKEAYILDTLAEAYFINGMREEALAAIDGAIALKPEENYDYYLAQRERFLNAELP